MQNLDYASVPTTKRDTRRRRGQVLMLLGYLPAVLLFAFMVWCFISIFLVWPY